MAVADLCNPARYDGNLGTLCTPKNIRLALSYALNNDHKRGMDICVMRSARHYDPLTLTYSWGNLNTPKRSYRHGSFCVIARRTRGKSISLLAPGDRLHHWPYSRKWGNFHTPKSDHFCPACAQAYLGIWGNDIVCWAHQCNRSCHVAKTPIPKGPSLQI